MFDWMKFVILAYILIDNEDEESLRSGISRLYYGFFGISRRYLINVKKKHNLKRKKGDVHFKVYNELLISNDSVENEIAITLNKLRFVRNNADYDDDDYYTDEYFKSFLKENEKELILAFNAFKQLKNNSSY